jgi:hypothetical protein
MTIRALTLFVAIQAMACFAGAPSTGPECDESQGKACPAGQVCVSLTCRSICLGVVDCAANEACLDSVCQAYSAACMNGEACEDGWYCDGAACRRDVTVGKACNDGSECEQGYCVDGVCCLTACDGECVACAGPLTGRPSGECAAIPVGQDPQGDCASARGCNGAAGCDPGKTLGASCAADVECGSEECVDGVCCESLCDGPCVTCFFGIDDPAPGTCRAVERHDDPDGDCSSILGCDGAGACDPGDIDGTFCFDDLDCSSVSCVDSVCCDAACDGLCEACTQAKTQVADGTCAPITAGTDPQNECTDNRMCSGIGTCMVAVGETCADTVECMAGRCISSVCSTTPSVPLLRFPTNGWYTGSLHVAKNLKPKFIWEESTDGAAPLSYQIQVDYDCSVSTFGACAFASPEADVTGATTTVTLGTALPVSYSKPVGRRYYWRVRACDRVANCSDWSQVRYLEVGREQKDLNGDGYADLVVGAPRYYSAAPAETGAVFVYYGSSIGLGVVEGTVLWPPESGSQFGASVSIVGDVNADGYPDLAVGAPGHDEAFTDIGRLYLYYGGPSGPVATPIIIPSPSAQTNAAFGAKALLLTNAGPVVPLGDVNADGFADVAAGMPMYSGSVGSSEGAVWIFLGGLGGLATAPSLVLPSPNPLAGGNFGAVLVAGDMNADGFSDLVASVKTVMTGDVMPYVRRVHVYWGGPSAAMLSQSQIITNPRASNQQWFGAGVGIVPNAEADGFMSLVIGSTMEQGGPAGYGALFSFGGGRNGISESYDLLWTPETQPMSGWGLRLAAMPDVNGDGVADVLLATIFTTDGSLTNVGKVHVCVGVPFGQRSVFASIPHPEPATGMLFGMGGTASIGDVNGDGLSDFAASDTARHVFVYHGASSPITNSVVRLGGDSPSGPSGNGFGEAVD